MSQPKGIEARVRLLHRANLVLLGLLLASMVLPILALGHVDSTQRARYLSYQLATELRQSSDDLTRFARTYVVTGDPRYERMYWDVLAIRNGEKPRPAEYWRIYWDFVAAGEASPRPGDVTVSLDQLMKEAGFTPAELAKLDEARRNSDALVRTETIAMNAMKGLYDDGTGKFTVRKAPDPAMAARIMHDTAYHTEKARIMRPIDEFLGMLDARTRADLSRSLALAWVPPILIALLVIALLIASVASQRTIRRDVIAPVLEISGAVQRVAEADLPALTEQMAALARGALAEVPEITTPPLEVRNDDELGLMARGVNAMLGRLGEARGALAEVTSNLRRLVDEARALTGAAVEGRLSVRGDAGALQGSYREVIQGVNATLDAIVTPLGAVAARMDEIARGTIPAALTVDGRGEFRALQESLNRCVAAINALVVDTATLAEAGAAGRLATRADAARHQGEFRRVIEGVNRTLDAVVTPLGAAARHLDELSRGRLPERIGEEFPGDFQRVKGSLETSIAAVRALLADTTNLADAAVEGRLGTRVEATRHQGDFARIVDGVNRAIEAIIAPVDEAATVLEKIARRDLTARMTGQYQGDHARIKESVNATAESLHEALTQVATAVDQVSSAATQIASSSQAVASGASEQAASLEETTSSLESVSTTTKQTADSAQQADHLARSARAAATDGSAAVEQMQGAMSRIKASAEGTSQIIRDINDIAFQTNLLALNAAVEAARAGEAGRGFAVVAEEVRSLALRAKEAASKTEELIKQSVKEAGQGEITAGQVASKLSEIAGGVSKVTDIVAEIATAAREQAGGIQQVTSAIGEMDKVTHQNAASAEESSSAASELSGQAEELAAMVAAFQLAEGASRSLGHGPSRRASPRAPAAAASRALALSPAAGPVHQGRLNGTEAKAPSRSAEEVFPLGPPSDDVSDF